MNLTRRAFLAGTCATAAGCVGGMLPSVPVVGLDRYRLPSTVVPRRYELWIAPDLSGGRFSGRATVEVTVREPVNEIVLNAAELGISAASARDEAGRTLPGTVMLDAGAERARIRFPETLGPGIWRLALSFTGTLRDDLRGFYRARAAGRGGTPTVLGLTQLQATDARRVFPCWDEPGFKAVFEVTLVVDRRLVALSNAAAVAEEPGLQAGTKAVRFAPTIPMSTYLMDTWVQRPGYPLVSAATESGGHTLVLSQRRFGYLAGADGAPGVWHVPIHVRVALPSGVQSRRLLLSSRETRVELPEPPTWVVVNAEGDGFYRTRYSADLLARLAGDLAGRLSPSERFVLVDDEWAAVLAGLAPAADYLDLTARLRDESDRSVWAALIQSLTYLERVVSVEQRPAVAALVRHRLGPAVAALGTSTVPGEDATRRELRADLLQALGTHGDDAATQASARRLYRQYREEATVVDPSLASAAIAVSAHAGGDVEYAEFQAQFRAARTPQDRWRYLIALTRFREPSLVERTLRLTRQGQVRSADAPYVLRHLLANVAAREAAWRFVREHWEAMRRGFTQAGLAVVCEGVAGLATPELERSVNEFFAGRRAAFGGKPLEQCLERLRIAVAFGEREAAALGAYLSRDPG